jgi:hypothetical protein
VGVQPAASRVVQAQMRRVFKFEVDSSAGPKGTTNRRGTRGIPRTYGTRLCYFVFQPKACIMISKIFVLGM